MAQQLQHTHSWQATNTDAQTAGYLTAIVVDAIMLYGAHHLLAWGVPFLNPSFNDVLWAIDLSLGASMIANAIYVAYDAPWFHHLSEAVLSALSLVSVYTLYSVFPFQFETDAWYAVTTLALWALMLAMGIALIVNIVRSGVDGLKCVMPE